jgi:hypothetical protein
MPRVFPRVLRHDVTQRTQNDWMVAIPAGLVIAGLLGFVAFYPTRTPQLASTGQTGTVGMAGLKAEPAAKKPVRYEATIENWKRYRAADKPAD